MVQNIKLIIIIFFFLTLMINRLLKLPGTHGDCFGEGRRSFQTGTSAAERKQREASAEGWKEEKGKTEKE